MQFVRTRHSLIRLAIIAGLGGLLAWWVLEMNQVDRDRINRTFIAPELRQIKTALDAYLRDHDQTYPPRLEVLAEAGLITDRAVLAGVSFPVAGKKRTELSPSDYIVVQPDRPWSERREMTPPRFALRADGQIEYWRP